MCSPFSEGGWGAYSFACFSFWLQQKIELDESSNYKSKTTAYVKHSFPRRGMIWIVSPSLVSNVLRIFIAVFPALIFATAPQAFSQSKTMVLIPAGEFQMGSNASPDELPHTVHLSAFQIDRYEVTQEKFEKVMADNPSDFSGANRPVERVTWYEARDYCKKFGKRLPTEAEWEKAARGGTETVFYWGDAMDDSHAWYWDNAAKTTHAVGQKKPNGFGLYDTAGNVWEWVADYYGDAYYAASRQQDPRGPFTGKYRSMRGGSWKDFDNFLRASRRNYDLPAGRFNYIGFRCAQSAG